MTDWHFMTVVLLIAFCGVKLTEIAAGVTDVRDRLKHIDPITKAEA
jgi:hypothetical protein